MGLVGCVSSQQSLQHRLSQSGPGLLLAAGLCPPGSWRCLGILQTWIISVFESYVTVPPIPTSTTNIPFFCCWYFFLWFVLQFSFPFLHPPSSILAAVHGLSGLIAPIQPLLSPGFPASCCAARSSPSPAPPRVFFVLVFRVSSP